MDFYFTDRKFNLLGVASTSGSTDISLANEEDKLSIEDSVRTLAGSLFYGPESRKQAESMSTLGNYVLYKDESGRSVWTTIMEINNDPLAGECVFLAEDAGVDLINELVGPYTADKAYPIASYISRFTADSGFKIGVNEISNLSRKLEWESEESTALARILSVATQFDNAELEFRFEVNGLEVVERYIDIFKKRGKDERVTLYVDKDINRITTSGNLYELGTSLYGIGGTPEGKDNPITLKGYKYTDKTGRYVLGSDGIMRDTVAVQKRSRLLSNDNPAPKSSHIQRRKTYETTDQKTLCDDVLRDLKKMAEVELNYEAEIVSLPYGVKIGDTIYLVDEQGELYLSARVLELVRCYSEDRYLATLGNYLIKDSGVDVNLQELADKLKDQIKPGDTYYPWTRYADDANGTGMSSVPDGKTYMATVYRKNDPIASDNPEDYAGLWVKIKGEDGEAGQTPVVHQAWSWSADGTDRFTTVYPGENLVLTTKQLSDGWNATWAGWSGTREVTEKGIKLTSKGSEQTGVGERLSVEYLGGKKITMTFKARGVGNIESYLMSDQPPNLGMGPIPLTSSAEFKEYKKTLTVAVWYSNKITSFSLLIRGVGNWFEIEDGTVKIELTDEPTIYTPSPSEDYANAYPLYEGTYTDYSETASQNPADYTWRRIIGESGQGGDNGADGVGIANTKTDYQLHTSATTPPTGTWVTSPPAVTVGKYLWTRTILEYTDGTKSTPAYSVSGGPGANGSDGKDGQDGAPGADALPIFSGYVTNEAIILSATNSGAVSDFSKATGTFVTYLGQDQLTSGVTYSRVSQSGVTATINQTTGAYSVTAASADTGMVVFKAVYQGIEIQKIVSVTKAKQGDQGVEGLPAINGSGQLVFNNRYERWPVSIYSAESLPKTGWAYTSGVEMVEPESDFPAHRIARIKARASGTIQFWSTGMPVTGGTLVRFRGQVRSNEVIATSVADKSFACSRFFAPDVPDTTNSSASSAINGKATSAYLRTNGTMYTNPGVLLESTVVPTFTKANTWYDFEVIQRVPDGAAWFKVSSYSDWFTPTQFFEYRNFTVVAYQKGDPTGIVSSTSVPSSPYVGMLWQNTGNVSGYISNATYRWNGSAWEIYQFTAQNILAETFTGFVFRGVEFIGSKFVSEFDIPIGTETGTRAVGQTVIENGGMVTDMVEYLTDGNYDKHLEFSPNKGILMTYKGRQTSDTQEAQLTPEGLRIKTPVAEAILSVATIYSLVNPARNDTAPPDDANRKGVVVNYFRVGNLVNVAIKFELLKDTGWVALAPSPPSGYAPTSMYQASGVAGSISYRGQTCMVYCNTDGLRLIPTTGQGTGVFQLSLTWTTNDPFPYGDS